MKFLMAAKRYVVFIKTSGMASRLARMTKLITYCYYPHGQYEADDNVL